MILKNTQERIEANRAVMANYWRQYQLELLWDRSRFRVIKKSRQIGISEAIIYESIQDCLSRPYYNVFWVSISLREAKDLIRRASIWIDLTLPAITGGPPIATCKKTQIEFPNGSKIEIVPANRVRGRTGSIYIDEAVYIPRMDEVMAAIMPATEARKDLHITMISTPLGPEGVFYDVWQGATSGTGPYKDWSYHDIDVYRAAKDGFPVDVDELRARYPRDIFKSEFEAQFFSNQLLQSAMYEPEEFELPDRYELHGGTDWASVNDRSVLGSVISPHEGPKRICPPFNIKPASMPMDFNDQEDILNEYLRDSAYTSLTTDGAGEGSATSQNLRSKYGSMVNVIKGSQWSKVHAKVPFLRRDMESKDLLIANDRDLLRDFRSIKKTVMSNRTIKYDAIRDMHGHADSFDASLLAYYGSCGQTADDVTVRSGSRRSMPRTRRGTTL